ncbi:MAG: YncE family protein [Gemmatimonadota bacterium]
MFGKTFTGTAVAMSLFAAGADDARAQTVRPIATEVGATGTVVVVSGSTAEALLFDPFSRRLLGRFPTGPDPRGVAISPDGRYAYVTSDGIIPGGVGASSGGNGEIDAGLGLGGVTVLDIAQRRVHAVFALDDYRDLDAIRVGADGERLWMTSDEGGIVEMDAHTGEVKMLWKTGGADPSTLTLSRDNRRIFVSNTGSDHVTMIDRMTVVPTTATTGRRPEGLALSSNGRELWVANSGDHTISVFSARTLKEKAVFASGGTGPTRLQFHPAGHEVWVSHRGSREVTILDVASAAVLARLPIAGEPRSLAFSDDGTTAYVSVPGSHRVDVVDVARREVVGSLDAGQATTGLAWSEQEGRSSGR